MELMVVKTYEYFVKLKKIIISYVKWCLGYRYRTTESIVGYSRFNN
jgi:hypothetical protein